MATPEHPYVFHLVQAKLWDPAVANNETYFPPTYKVDGFTHGTANPEKLLAVANHFYPQVQGDWYCLQMTVESLSVAGVKTIFEGTAPVGDKQPDFDGSDDELLFVTCRSAGTILGFGELQHRFVFIRADQARID
ncbi:MAG: hypothetical protein AAF194_03660, partial [Pseudomonadota bacterium]